MNEIQIGSYVEIIASTDGSQIGTVGRVESVNEDGSYHVSYGDAQQGGVVVATSVAPAPMPAVTVEPQAEEVVEEPTAEVEAEPEAEVVAEEAQAPVEEEAPAEEPEVVAEEPQVEQPKAEAKPKAKAKGSKKS